MLNFDSHKSASRSAHMVHFSAAFYNPRSPFFPHRPAGPLSKGSWSGDGDSGARVGGSRPMGTWKAPYRRSWSQGRPTWLMLMTTAKRGPEVIWLPRSEQSASW